MGRPSRHNVVAVIKPAPRRPHGYKEPKLRQKRRRFGTNALNLRWIADDARGEYTLGTESATRLLVPRFFVYIYMCVSGCV